MATGRTQRNSSIQSHVYFEGYLEKKGKYGLGTKKKRYFVLVGAVAVGSKSLDAHERRVLRYYKDWRSFHTRASPQVQVSLCCTLLSVCFRACHEHDQGQQGELACEGLEVDGDCGSSVEEGFRFLLTWSNGRQMPCACETFEQVPLRRCANFFHLPPVNHARATCSLTHTHTHTHTHTDRRQGRARGDHAQSSLRALDCQYPPR